MASVIIVAAFYIVKSTSRNRNLRYNLKERVKELKGLYRISEAAEKFNPDQNQILENIVTEIPASYQYPADCAVRITYRGEKYETDNFRETKWMQRQEIIINDQSVGKIEVSYLAEYPEEYRGTVFLKEEFEFLDSIVSKLNNVLKNLEQEKEIREQKQFLSITLNSIGDGLIITDKKGRIEKLNTIAENLTGWSIEEAQNKDIEEIFKIFNARTGEKAENPVEKVLKEGKIVGLANHTKLIAKDGNEYHIADSAAPIKTESGEIHGTVMVFRDVTRRREAEAELKKLNEIYRTLSMVNQLIVREKSLKKLLDEAVQIIADYGKYQSIWIGRIDNNLERIRVLSFSESNTKNLKQKETYNIDLNNSVINFKEELISKDNDKIIVNNLSETEEINSFLDSSCGSRAFFCLKAFDKPWGVLSFCSAEENNFNQTEVKLLNELTGDISLGIEKIINEKRRKDSEKRLKKSEQKYRRLFENSPVGIFKTTSKGKVKMINPHMAEILGFDSIPETINHYNDLKKELYVNSERRDQFIRLMQENREVNNFAYQAYDKNKNIMWLEMDARVSREYDDGTFMIDGFCWDITERKKNQEKIQYIGFHDKLTNLYNRAFLEEEIKRIVHCF
jgi:PAS domain S-box-containing protein